VKVRDEKLERWSIPGLRGAVRVGPAQALDLKALQGAQALAPLRIAIDFRAMASYGFNDQLYRLRHGHPSLLLRPVPGAGSCRCWSSAKRSGTPRTSGLCRASGARGRMR